MHLNLLSANFAMGKYLSGLSSSGFVTDVGNETRLIGICNPDVDNETRLIGICNPDVDN
jgi:hypothetical protein